jgi:hypothetical protein
MRTIDPMSPSVRSRTALAARVEEKLKASTGPADVLARLDPPECVAWLLDRVFRQLRDESFYLRSNTFADTPVDLPAFLGAVADVSQPVDGLVAELLRWTAHRVTLHLQPTDWSRRPVEDSLKATFVPDVWHHVFERVDPFFTAVVERWPEDLDPLRHPASPYVPRPLLPPTDGACRYPSVAVGFTAAGAHCAVRCAEPPTWTKTTSSVVFALWQAGVSDTEQHEFMCDFEESDPNFFDLVSRWVRVDGAAADPLMNGRLTKEILRPPLLRRYELEEWPQLLLVDDDFAAVAIPFEGESFRVSLKAASYLAAEALVVDADRLTRAVMPMFIEVATRTKLMVLAGKGRGHRLALEALGAAGMMPVDCRRH